VTDDDLHALLARAKAGDADARDQAVELAGERGDDATLMRLAKQGQTDAACVLIELASEHGASRTSRASASPSSASSLSVST
jgi:predicted DsbA family dithiol-disulfide isomerase